MNAAKWWARQPVVWLFVVGFALSLLPILLLPSEPSAPLPPEDRGPLPLVFYWIAAALLLIMIIPISCFSGAMVVLVRGPDEAVLLPTPMRRSSLIQERLVGALATQFAAALGIALLFGLGVSALTSDSPTLTVLRFLAVAIPAIAFYTSGALLASYGWSWIPAERRRQAGGVIGLAVLAVLVIGLPSLFLLDGNASDDPLFVLYAAWTAPFGKLLGGSGLGLFDLFALILSGGVSALAATLALRWPYQLYSDTGAAPPRPEALSMERPRLSEFWRRIAVRLRVQYVDLGPGLLALLGRNVTAMFRVPYVVFNVAFYGALVLTILPLGWFGGPDFFAFASVMLAFFVAVLPSATLPGSQEIPEIVDVLPLTRGERYFAFVVPALVPVALPIGAFALGEAAGGVPAMSLLAGVAFVSSTAFFGVTIGFMLSLRPIRSAYRTGGPPLIPGLSALGRLAVLLIPMVVFPMEALAILFSSLRGSADGYLGALAVANLALAAGWSLAAVLQPNRPPRR